MIPLTLPAIPGFDLAGTVEDVGPAAAGLARGDEVFGQAMHPSTYAELVDVAPAGLARRPPALDALVAAALPVAGLAA